MKAGETGWVRVTVAETFKDGTFFVNANGFHDNDDVIPDHPALPAVARWLAEHNDALVYGQHTPGDWIDVIDAYADETDDLMDRMSLTVSVIPALRSLIAALTEGQG